MDDEPTTDDGSEYRPTDCLAMSGNSYGYGADEDTAILNCLRYARPFDDDTVEVVVWELYADSWQSHGMRGPERTAEQVSFTEWELPASRANEAGDAASDAYSALSWAKDDGEKTHEEGER